MNREFTPAAQRALAAAARWGQRPGQPLGPVQVLLGLLDEPECRGAVLLAARGIDAESVRRRWPELQWLGEAPSGDTVSDAAMGTPAAGGTQWGALPRGRLLLSDAVRELLHEAECRLSLELTSAALATEHLLLGLVSGQHEVARWLREQGVDAEELEAEILRLHGVGSDALPVDAPIGPPLDIPDESPLCENSAATVDEKQPDARGSTIGAEKETPSVAQPTAEVVADGNRREGRSTRPEAMGKSDAEACALSQNGVPHDTRVVRVLDAAGNRAAEAARVVEDYVRFVLDDLHLTACSKQLRHDLNAALGCVSRIARLTSRDTRHDVGTRLSTEAESHRASPCDVLAANFGRLEQALRSLEEFGKLIDAQAGGVFKQLRYRAYTLEKAVLGTVEARERLAGAQLYVLVDGGETLEEFEGLASELVAAGVPLIQLRDKRLNDRQLLERARRLREMTRGTSSRFIMNDRPDLAVLADADGVHVGQDELRVSDVRAVVGTTMLVGVSTHSLQQARDAVLEGADYIGIGPVFPSATKRFETFAGLEVVETVAREIRLPAFAIGGIDTGNVDRVLATGIGRVAVSHAVVQANHPAEAARELLERLQAFGLRDSPAG